MKLNIIQFTFTPALSQFPLPTSASIQKPIQNKTATANKPNHQNPALDLYWSNVLDSPISSVGHLEKFIKKRLKLKLM